MANSLNIDLARPLTSSLIVTDAAPASVSGHGLIPVGADLDTTSVRFVDAPFHLSVHYDHFVPQFSVKARIGADAPTLEATAVTLEMRRITRSARNHGVRAVALVDAQALMHALRKGRSSSGAFKIQLQQVAALCLCADVSMTYGYIPTSCNPADPPSRGVKRTIRRMKVVKSPCGSWQTHCKSMRIALRHLRLSPAQGLPSRLRRNGSFDSSSSDSLTVQP